MAASIRARRNSVALVLLVLLVPQTAPLHAGQKVLPLVAQLDAEFKNQQFVTVTELWNALRITEHGETTLLVDTELYPNKTKRAELRATSPSSPTDIAPHFVSNARGFLHSLPQGSKVQVTKVEFKNDRLELWLRSIPGGAYAKLKMMYGKDWQKSQDYDRVIELIADGLRIERIERRRSLDTEYVALKSQLSPGVSERESAASQLARSQALHARLQRLAANRAEFEKLARTSTQTEIEDYARALADLEPKIQRLETTVKRDRVVTARDALAQFSADAVKYRQSVVHPPKTTGEANQQESALKDWEQNIVRRREVQATLVTLGESVSAAETGTQQQDSEEIRTRRAAIKLNRGVLAMMELSSQYKDLERRRIQLLDAYTRAFGTSKQREAAAQLISHLQRMIENRLSAQKLGATSAGAQAAELQRALERIRRQ